MPELPEVEAVCRKLKRDAAGERILRLRMFRNEDPALIRAARRSRIEDVTRRAKNVLIQLDTGQTIRAHLRMTGNLYVIPDIRRRPITTTAYLTLETGGAIILDDPRTLGRLELLTPQDVEKLSASLGPEPLSPGFTFEALRSMVQNCRQPAKLFLLDQKHIAGIGNIYAAEVLHRARIHPEKPVNTLRRSKIEALHHAIVSVLGLAVQSACKAYTGPGRYNSEETFPVAVYGREGQPCTACGGKVRRIRQGGRSTYYCPKCQRPNNGTTARPEHQ